MSFLEVKNIVKNFGGLRAVNDISFTVKQGEILGLIGPNGSGKTTIFNLINGFYPLTSGEIYFQGRRIDGLPPHKICALGIGRTFQVVKPLKRMTVLENVMAGAFLHTTSISKARSKALEVLEFCGLYHRKDMDAKNLTIADRKRLEIARALATEPKLLLLDETAAGLNPKETEEAINIILKIREIGITIIIVEHIMKVIMGISDRILAISFGREIALGTPREVANHPEVIKAYLGEAYA
ncbi:amino acid/amide ABC transporter ATP-binding protein 1, HAAT family [Desulfofundulus australicus DSM 11792]|uniref:Amino acid/amide ABC transporter ATP-binding protein 1, HAAT family n=1 Tax=Desulfofundulus australicus DSM 11792 TaxID=1121425 RepID=A0A1M4TZF1_9FIRM|nr:ABC transporter ATP-binding protein [Desulfofundulus australicus]SHE49810.1 amino acid/amide ABC transporter ATP-binding protein 1, HAAT family [Desulfofundulus australicus DSM 11792]